MKSSRCAYCNTKHRTVTIDYRNRLDGSTQPHRIFGTRSMKRVTFFLLISLCFPAITIAQDVIMSPPQKVNTGISKVEILGRTDQGILIRHTQKEDDEIVAFYDNMQQHWRKKIPVHEKNAIITHITTFDDSVIFFYTISAKGVTELKAAKTSSRIESQARLVLCDSLSRNAFSQAPSPRFRESADKRFILAWFPDANFENNKLLHATCYNALLEPVWKTVTRLPGLEHPEVIDATLDSAGNAVFVCGDYRDRSIRNDFDYTALLTLSIRDRAMKIHPQIITNKDILYSRGLVKTDVLTGNVLFAGLYAHAVGTESSGVFLMKYNASLDTVEKVNYLAHTTEFLSQLTGSATPKKNDGFYDFELMELIVKRDGGAVILAESHSTSSETYSSSGVGGFGFSGGFVVNTFHYDDIMAISFKPDGSAEWKTILHKKQETEGDGGFFSSFAMMIAKRRAYLLYNDQINGQTVVAYYELDADGNQSRTELLNAERKGIMPAMKQGKQVSANELVIPSFKRNYLQFIKITF